MKKVYILISITSSQNQTLLNVIEYFKSIGISMSNIYLVTNTNDNIIKSFSINLIRLSKISSIKSFFQQIFLRKNKKLLYDMILNLNKYDSIQVLVPHFLNILSNYFYTASSRRLGKDKLKIALYPDGMLSYQPYSINSKYDPYLLKRWLVGKLIGTPFKLFNGPIADPFNVIDFIYTYLPNETIEYNSKKLIKIEFPKSDISCNNMLILGHFNQSRFQKVDLISISRAIKKLPILKKVKRIYYKIHPRLKSSRHDLFYRVLKLDKSLPIEIVQDNQPIEMSIKKLKSSTVIAAVSTSLVNLKLKFGEDLKCYYFGLDDYVSSDYTKYYNKIFKQLKINNLIQNNV